MADSNSTKLCECGCGLPVKNRFRQGHNSPPNKTHGITNSRTYTSWNAMMMRCTNPKSDHYPRYGGRGIAVCDRWLTFSNFLADMGLRPTGKSLDRIDVNGNYEPTNCRWASPAEQQRNRADTVYITYKGETRSIADWAETLRFPIGTLWTRYSKGYSPEEIFSPKFAKTSAFYEFRGETLSLRQWSSRYGIKHSTVHTRIRLGWSLERALTTPVRPKRSSHQ